MTTLGLLDIYDKIHLSNGDYCKVCFKTSRERRLVNPVSFKRFLNAINGGVTYKTQIKVCYLCEALALSAMKFHRAVVLGAEIEDLCQRIQTEGLRNIVWTHLNGIVQQSTARNKRVCQRAVVSQAELRNIQTAVPYSLQCTDTLVVTVDRPAEPVGTVQEPKTAPPVGRIARNQAKQSQVDDPSEVLIVLDDDTPQVHAAAAKMRPVIQHQKRTVSVRNQDTNQVILHPMVTGSDGNIYVPTLKLQILPNNVFKSVSDDVLLFYTSTPVREDTSLTTTPDETEEIDKSTTGYDYNTFLSLRNEGNTTSNGMQELIHTENMNIVLNFDDDSVNSKKKRYEIDPLSTDHNGTSNCNDNDISNEENNASEKRPLLSMDRVDWEDKIPMDVISFMDATDPNPSDRIMQPAPPRRPGPMGFISDVRTVEEDLDVEILDTVECIDLC